MRFGSSERRFKIGIDVGGPFTDFGDPRQRDRSKVADEVCNGLISPAVALDVYGAVPKS